MTVDLFAPVDARAFHARDLPARIAAGNGAMVRAALRPGFSLGVDLGDTGQWTYRTTDTSVEILDGTDEARAVITMTPAAFTDLVNERWSLFGLLYGGMMQITRGDFGPVSVWDPPLQALFFGRPIYSSDVAATLVDQEGQPLDLTRTFTLEPASDVDTEERDAPARHFFRTAGFLHLKNVFSLDEVEELRDAVEHAVPLATPDDGRSWWATNADGEDICCRLTYLNLRSPRVAALVDDPRFARIAALGADDVVGTADRLDGIDCVMKRPAITAGLSDLPWHRDCGNGGHPVHCPAVNIGLQLDAANAANGHLQFLAGSADYTNHPPTEAQVSEWPIVPVNTEPGDCTAHFGHTMHVAPPPTSPDANRRVLYLGFHRPAILDVIGPEQGWNDILFTSAGGRIEPPR